MGAVTIKSIQVIENARMAEVEHELVKLIPNVRPVDGDKLSIPLVNSCVPNELVQNVHNSG
jgi:hypothetical protein